MKLRKTNAIFSLISTILLLSHAISLAAWMLSQGTIPKPPSFIPRALVMFFLVHAIISIVLTISIYKGNRSIKGKIYLKMNATTMLQRISGAVIFIFTTLHILGATGTIHVPHVIHAMSPPFFFLLVLVHIAVSTSKAFITLGIGNARFIKCADIFMKVICAITLLADAIGFYLYLY